MIRGSSQTFDQVTLGTLARRGTVAFAASLALSVAGESPASAAFRSGDIGFSLKSDAGRTWIYGDSWVDGQMVRNAITLDGRYVGTIPSGVNDTWIWPGAPFLDGTGRIVSFGGKLTQTKPGIWGFKLIGGVRTSFTPDQPGSATVTDLPEGQIIWAAATAQDATGTVVYGIDSKHRVHAGRPQSDGSVTEVSTLGGTLSGQFAVLQDAQSNWWLVGQPPFLSRKIVAYPISNPTGKVTGRGIKLYTIPKPGPKRVAYAATVHADLDGLLTYAVNGSGDGVPYGLERIDGFWPTALEFALDTVGSRRPTIRKDSKKRIAEPSGIDDVDRIDLWPAALQPELDSRIAAAAALENGQAWLNDLGGAISGLSEPSVSAPGAWDLGSTLPEQPAGEDLDSFGSFLVPQTRYQNKRQQAAAKAAEAAAIALAKAERIRDWATERASRLAAKLQDALATGDDSLIEKAQRSSAKASEAALLAEEEASAAAEHAADALMRAHGVGRRSW